MNILDIGLPGRRRVGERRVGAAVAWWFADSPQIDIVENPTLRSSVTVKVRTTAGASPSAFGLSNDDAGDGVLLITDVSVSAFVERSFHALLFAEAAVNDYELLLDSLVESEVLSGVESNLQQRLDGDDNGTRQITDAPRLNHNAKAADIISRGFSGRLQPGKAQLDGRNDCNRDTLLTSGETNAVTSGAATRCPGQHHHRTTTAPPPSMGLAGTYYETAPVDAAITSSSEAVCAATATAFLAGCDRFLVGQGTHF